jgi:hypothetical protein
VKDVELNGDGDPDELGAEAETAADAEEPSDLYDEGGVVTAGLPVAQPEQGATCARSGGCRC